MDRHVALTPDYAAEIGRILDGPPSKVAFRALCAALGRAGCPKELVSVCEERLSSWPDEVRQAPWSWLAALEAGHTEPTWQLVRSLVLMTDHCGMSEVALPDPRTRSEVRGVTHLDFGWYDREQFAVLVENLEHWDNLTAIKAGGLRTRDGDVVARLVGADAFSRIESLDLVTDQEGRWQSEEPPFRPPTGRPLRLRHVGLRAPDLVDLLRSGLVPDLRSVDVLVFDIDEARDLAACAELAQIERMAIGFRCGRNGSRPWDDLYFGNVIEEDNDACEVFFDRADLSNLRNLTVRGTVMGRGREGLGARGVDAIVASGVLRQLTELTLELLPVGDSAIARALDGIDHDRIEKLTLVDLVATDVTASAFVAPGAYPRLRHLDLSGNYLGEKGARQLATEVNLPALEHLDLSGRRCETPYYWNPVVQPVGDSGATAWACSPNAMELRYLNLAVTGLGPSGLTALMESEHLRRLETLDLAENPVGSWPASLRTAPAWRTLRTLNLTVRSRRRRCRRPRVNAQRS